MEIRYFGHSSFLLKNKTTSVVTDPYSTDSVGLKFPKNITADIVTVSHDHPDHNHIANIEGTPFVISGPGEYEIKGISILGYSSFHDEEKGAKRGKNTIYKFEIDNISICHLGDLGCIPTNEEIEKLDGIDILLVPVGGFYTIDPEQAEKIIAEIEPSVVIPMHFGRTELDKKTFGDLKPLTEFLKVMGSIEVQPVPKLMMTKDKLPEKTQVFIFE